MNRISQIVVLGSFLASEWNDLWQRQQEFTTRLMDMGDVWYFERAAGGRITPAKVAGRARGMLAARRSPQPSGDVSTGPKFVRWTQLPSSARPMVALNARRVVRRIESMMAGVGTHRPDLVYVGAPNEVWAEVLRRLGVPFWYDMPERFLYSESYRTVSRETMRWMVANATLVTVDTEVGRQDWRDLRDDIVVIPHGSKQSDFEPDWNRLRDKVYYVGSDNPAIDVGFLRAASGAAGSPVQVIGSNWTRDLDASLELLGWVDGHEIPRMISDATAGLVPYVLDEFTEGVLPTKIYDYFLAGAPVIASSLPSLRDHFGVYVVDGTLEGIADALTRAQALTSQERRALREFARANTWRCRFDDVIAALSERGIELDG